MSSILGDVRKASFDKIGIELGKGIERSGEIGESERIGEIEEIGESEEYNEYEEMEQEEYSSDDSEKQLFDFRRKAETEFYYKKEGIYYIRRGGNQKITLFKNQIDHVEKISKIWDYNRYAISASPTGTGKTFITLWLYLNYIAGGSNFKQIIVVGQQSSLIVFALAANSYNIKNMQFITYSSLSCKGKMSKIRGTPRNEYLTCQYEFTNTMNKNTGKYKPKPRYAVTQNYMDIADDGILLVFDEFHRLKNKSAQSYASQSLARYVIKGKDSYKSRVIFLSATPLQNQVHATRYFNIFGTINGNKYVTVDKRSKTVNTKNAERMRKEIARILKTNDIKVVYKEVPLLKDVFSEAKRGVEFGQSDFLSLQIYNKIWTTKLTESMIREDTGFKHIVRNRIVNISKEGMDNYILGLFLFREGQKKMMMAMSATGSAKFTMLIEAYSLLSLGVQYMERGKLDSFVRLAKRYLDEDPNCRVLIFLWLKVDGVDVIKRKFKKYPHLVLKGGLSDDEKMYIVKLFQQENGPRLLISTIQTGSESLSFHDIVGGQKRYSLISPSYDYVRIAQAAGRTNRVGVKSDSMVEYLYGGDTLFSEKQKVIYPLERYDQIPEYTNEMAIMNNIRNKEEITSGALNLEEQLAEIRKGIYGNDMKETEDTLEELNELKTKLDMEYSKKSTKLIAGQLPVVTETIIEKLEYKGDFSNEKVEQLMKEGYKVSDKGAPEELLETKQLTTTMSKSVNKLKTEFNKNKDLTYRDLIEEYKEGRFR